MAFQAGDHGPAFHRERGVGAFMDSMELDLY
jgi:hypothetical protein